MYFISDAYRLRDAIRAERREEREAAAKNKPEVTVAKTAAPVKAGRSAFFSLVTLRMQSGRLTVRQG